MRKFRNKEERDAFVKKYCCIVNKSGRYYNVWGDEYKEEYLDKLYNIMRFRV